MTMVIILPDTSQATSVTGPETKDPRVTAIPAGVLFAEKRVSLSATIGWEYLIPDTVALRTAAESYPVNSGILPFDGFIGPAPAVEYRTFLVVPLVCDTSWL